VRLFDNGAKRITKKHEKNQEMKVCFLGRSKIPTPLLDFALF
jgi:hypothetical protein